MPTRERHVTVVTRRAGGAANTPVRIAEVVAGSGVVLIVVLCLLGGVSKLHDPRPAFELSFAILGRDEWSWIPAAVAGGLEMGVVAAAATRVVSRGTFLALGVGLFALFSLWLAVAAQYVGLDADCACLTAFETSSVRAALFRNGFVVTYIGVAAVGHFHARRASKRQEPDDRKDIAKAEGLRS